MCVMPCRYATELEAQTAYDYAVRVLSDRLGSENPIKTLNHPDEAQVQLDQVTYALIKKRVGMMCATSTAPCNTPQPGLSSETTPDPAPPDMSGDNSSQWCPGIACTNTSQELQVEWSSLTAVHPTLAPPAAAAAASPPQTSVQGFQQGMQPHHPLEAAPSASWAAGHPLDTACGPSRSGWGMPALSAWGVDAAQLCQTSLLSACTSRVLPQPCQLIASTVSPAHHLQSGYGSDPDLAELLRLIQTDDDGDVAADAAAITSPQTSAEILGGHAAMWTPTHALVKQQQQLCHPGLPDCSATQPSVAGVLSGAATVVAAAGADTERWRQQQQVAVTSAQPFVPSAGEVVRFADLATSCLMQLYTNLMSHQQQHAGSLALSWMASVRACHGPSSSNPAVSAVQLAVLQVCTSLLTFGATGLTRLGGACYPFDRCFLLPVLEQLMVVLLDLRSTFASMGPAQTLQADMLWSFKQQMQAWAVAAPQQAAAALLQWL